MQRDALLEAGIDHRHLFEDCASGVKDDRSGLAKVMDLCNQVNRVSLIS
nr:hypothetical protein [unidentified bacterial endosymbiont]